MCQTVLIVMLTRCLPARLKLRTIVVRHAIVDALCAQRNCCWHMQTDRRLRHEATWEVSSRYKAQAADAHRGQTQNSGSAEEALRQRRQALAAKLAQEGEELRRQLVQPPQAAAAARRQELLDQARIRASALSERRAQVHTESLMGGLPRLADQRSPSG